MPNSQDPENAWQESLGIPVLETRTDLIKTLGIPAGMLEAMLNKPEYRKVNLPKPDGSFRSIAVPSDRLKAVQAWILRSLLDPIAIDQAATAFRPGYTLLNNVGPHVHQPFVFTMDLVDFFGHVGMVRVIKVFKSLGYSDDIAMCLARLCCHRGRLPQGAVTSPSLSNLVCTGMDREIRQYATKMNVMYTRYADDITLSARSPDVLFRTVKFVRYVVRREGFRIHPRKTKVMLPGDQHKITGLIINDDNKITIGRQKYRELRSAIDRLKRGISLEGYPHGHKSVLGWLCYLRGIDPENADRLEAFWLQRFGSKPKYDFKT